MEPGLAQLVEHLTVVVEHISCNFSIVKSNCYHAH
jgi:hypothetical protein